MNDFLSRLSWSKLSTFLKIFKSYVLVLPILLANGEYCEITHDLKLPFYSFFTLFSIIYGNLLVNVIKIVDCVIMH